VYQLPWVSGRGHVYATQEVKPQGNELQGTTWRAHAALTCHANLHATKAQGAVIEPPLQDIRKNGSLF